jgi:hypothetical protein
MQNSQKIGQDDIEQIVNQPKNRGYCTITSAIIGTKHCYVGLKILNHQKHESRSTNIYKSIERIVKLIPLSD